MLPHEFMYELTGMLKGVTRVVVRSHAKLERDLLLRSYL